MTIYSVYIINKGGGLIYQYDNNVPKIEVEKTFSYPLELTLKIHDEKVVVAFGQRDGIKVGHVVLAVNGLPVNGRQLEDGQDVMELLNNDDKYPLNIKFGRPKLSKNEEIMFAGMFHSLFAISVQLSPVPHSTGIQMLETDTFKLCCSQTLTGIKFVVLSDPRQVGQDSFLKKLYEIYADYALKNPFYSIDMPINCELFDVNLQQALEQADKITVG
ncbi:hypothetical protein LSH36_873g00079 [Paralvinella palmiformis]|uniref:Trafficking protein particle complex subunit n=1 Tax=Paralvinella palmiformis TaxID=53620 RepID=A0AAD9IYP7_9ANNE|nr:hypothetical protein LSH36_873g00079 [Paralvinella palmiformis]